MPDERGDERPGIVFDLRDTPFTVVEGALAELERLRGIVGRAAATLSRVDPDRLAREIAVLEGYSPGFEPLIGLLKALQADVMLARSVLASATGPAPGEPLPGPESGVR